MKPTKGLYLDCLPEDQPEGTYRNARNILIAKLDGAVTNEDGNELIVEGYPGDRIIHIMAVGNKDYVLWITNHLNYPFDCKISRLLPNGTLRTIVASREFGFSMNTPIKSVYIKNFRNEVVIAWTDDHTPPRILNIDNLPFTVDSSDGYLVRSDLMVLTELFPKFNSPYVLFDTRSDSGGQLMSGTYYFSFAYETSDGSGTNWTNVFGPFMVTDDLASKNADQYDGCEAGQVTSKCLEVKMLGLDIRYNYLKIAVIRRINGTYEAFYIGKRRIFGISDSFIYNGGETHTTMLLEDILMDTAVYKTAKTMTILDNRLYLANLTQEERIDYQSYANGIQVGWVTGDVALDSVHNSFKDEVTIFNKRGFFPDEVYAFYICFLLQSGERSEAYHIPGRAPKTGITFEGVTLNETDKIADLTSQLPILENDLYIDPDIRFFHTRETAGPDGEMGYWENSSEKYPPYEEYGELQDQPVRHHKFPGMKFLQSQGLFTEGTVLGGAVGEIKFKDDPTRPDRKVEIFTKTVPNSLTMSGGFSDYGTWDSQTNEFTFTSNCRFAVKGSYNLRMNAIKESGKEGAVNAEVSLNIRKISSNFQIVLASPGANHPPHIPDLEEQIEDMQVSGPLDIEQQMLAGEKIRINMLVTGTGNILDWVAELNLVMEFGSPSYDMIGTYGKVLGIKVSNIVIPEELRQRVTGFEIMYAKRTMANMRVLGVSGLFQCQNVHPLNGSGHSPSMGSRGVKVDGYASAGLNPETGRIHIFDLMKDMVAVAPSYMKTSLKLSCQVSFPNTQEYRASAEDPAVNDETTKTQAYFVADFLSPIDVTEVSSADELRHIQDYTYVPGDTAAYFGSTDIDNTWGEAFAYFRIKHRNGTDRDSWKIDNGVLDPAMGSDTASTFLEQIYLATLFQHKKDVYSSFMGQELVSTCKVGILTGEESLGLDQVFGGDTYLGKYGIRITSAINSSPTVRSTNKFQALKAVYQFPVYSINNVSLRHEGKNIHESYYPKVNANIEVLRRWVRRAADSYNSNTFVYNHDYTAVNDLNKCYPWNKDTRFLNTFPFRIIRSKSYLPETKEFTMRTYLPNDYFEMPRDKGEVVNIEEFAGVLFINMEKSLFKTVGNSTLDTSTIAVTLGTGDIFRMPPQEIIHDKDGYAGCQHITSCLKTKVGYFFVDSQQGKIFLVGDKISEISNKGMRHYFLENAGTSESGLSETPNLWSMNTAWYSAAFDEKYNRLLFSKREITHDGDRSFTMSYSFGTESWVCWHDYIPGILGNSRNEVISANGSSVYRHNAKGVPGYFYLSTYPSFQDVVFNPYPDTSKVFTSLDWRTRVFDKDEVYRHTETFSSIMLWDSVHCSGEIPLVYFGNIRNVEGVWRFNAFRDLVKDSALPFMDKEGNLITSNIDVDKDVLFKGRFIDNYIIVRWIEDNLRKNTLYLYSIDANNRVSFR